MPPTFFAEQSGEDDPLYPITAARLAFLTRGVLLDVSPTAVLDEGVYSEVWTRHAELVADIKAEMNDFRYEYNRSSDEVDLRDALLITARALIYASFWFLAIGIVEALDRWVKYGHGNLISLVAPEWVSWLIFAVLFCAAFSIARLVCRRLTAQISDYIWRQDPQVKNHLVAAIGAMVNEIVNRKNEQTSGVLLQHMPAPSLVEFGSAAVVRSQSFNDVLSLVDAHVTSAIGVAGARGAGKSTLLRLLCNASEIELAAQDRIGVYLAAPSISAESEFVKIIYGTTVGQVLGAASVLADGRSRWRRFLRIRPDTDIALAQQTLERITGSTSHSRQSGLGISRLGLSINAGRQRTWTEREFSHADWVADFRDYLERHRLLNGHPIIIAIDELDKVTNPAQAIEVINGLKDLFHIQGTHFVVSVSDDALRSFATRGVPVRDAFDSSFDSVIEIPNLKSRESYQVLQARVRFFPNAASLFCHAWSAGVPRDLIRVARSCVAVPHRLNHSIPITEVTQQILRRDVIEFVDALVRGEYEHAEENTARLLELRRMVSRDSVPVHLQLANSGGLHPFKDDINNRFLSSLQPFLDIAALVSEYFFSPRNSQEWANGIESGKFHDDADLLAQAKAALAIHPVEAAWRIQHARSTLRTGL